MRSNDAGRSAHKEAARLSRRDLRSTTKVCALSATAAFILFTLAMDFTLGVVAAVFAAGFAFHLKRPTAAQLHAAKAWEKGYEGEVATKQLLDPLVREGWKVFHDRGLPNPSNLDHGAIPPQGGGIVVIDSKRWHYGWKTRLDSAGRLKCGERDQERDIKSLISETAYVARAFPGVPVVRLIVVHGATVEGHHLSLTRTGRDGLPVTIGVVSADALVPALCSIAGQIPRGGVPAAILAHDFAQEFPPYKPRPSTSPRTRSSL